MTLEEKYQKLLEFVKSISENNRFEQSDFDFQEFYCGKEEEAEKLLEKIGEI